MAARGGTVNGVWSQREGTRPVGISRVNDTDKRWRTHHSTNIQIMFKGSTTTFKQIYSGPVWDMASQPQIQQYPTLFSLIPQSCCVSSECLSLPDIIL